MVAGRGSGQVGRVRCRLEQGGHRLECLGERGLVLPDPGAERLLAGADELLLVVCLDGEVDPGQVTAQRAVRVGQGFWMLRRREVV